MSWDMSCIRRLAVLSDIGIFIISFSYSSQNIIFTIFQHAGKITASAVVWFNLLRYDCLIAATAYLDSWTSLEKAVILVYCSAGGVLSAIKLIYLQDCSTVHYDISQGKVTKDHVSTTLSILRGFLVPKRTIPTERPSLVSANFYG
jgi:hypothetical protein